MRAPNSTWGEYGAVGKKRVSHAVLGLALSVLRPRFVTLDEPVIGGFRGPANDYFNRDGRIDPRCHGRAWAKLSSGAPPGNPYDRLLRIHDRYRRGMQLVELAERRDACAFEWVAMVRPDLVFRRPVAPLLRRAPPSRVAYKLAAKNDFALLAPRRSAETIFVESSLRYWRCEQVSATKNEARPPLALPTLASRRCRCSGSPPRL